MILEVYPEIKTVYITPRGEFLIKNYNLTERELPELSLPIVSISKADVIITGIMIGRPSFLNTKHYIFLAARFHSSLEITII